MATRMSISNSVWTAIKASEWALERVLNFPTELIVIRADVYAPDPFTSGQRDCFITLHFRKGPGRLFGSIQTWVLLCGDGRNQLPGEQWSPQRVRIISDGQTGPGNRQSFHFSTGGVMLDDDDDICSRDANTAWIEADKRRIQYARV